MDLILRIVMLPVLLLQAIWVRSNARKLPEPDGPRVGLLNCAAADHTVRLLITGDSSAAGVGAPHQDEALSGHLTRALQKTISVDWTLAATTGHRTADTLARLKALPRQRFDIVVVALGVNEVTRFTAARTFHMEQSSLIDLLHDRFEAKAVVLSGVPPMAQFPALPNPLAWCLGRHADRLDAVLRALAAKRETLVHLPCPIALTDEVMASDGYHPSAAGYAVWAEAIMAALHQNAPSIMHDAFAAAEMSSR
ncbi:SGNH/GDSL hydrolase family protein [Phaeobacter sp.]|uniref:SGNH/GDSL hydrolase family protein n=1 Tax=Phaeobacter sp. TaxID=1902409 RepID=UPI0025EE97BC|nr:SGNH/GDSL hydrolase family protein [Phaeobacter sp.]